MADQQIKQLLQSMMTLKVVSEDQIDSKSATSA